MCKFGLHDNYCSVSLRMLYHSKQNQESEGGVVPQSVPLSHPAAERLKRLANNMYSYEKAAVLSHGQLDCRVILLLIKSSCIWPVLWGDGHTNSFYRSRLCDATRQLY